LPLDGAVHENHKLRAAATPPWAGSPVSRVAPAVVSPVTAPDAPATAVGAAKASLAGGVGRAPHLSITAPGALESRAMRYVVPDTTDASARLTTPVEWLSLPATRERLPTADPV
jgi:hypothetical protein